jgi:hypothetical protein
MLCMFRQIGKHFMQLSLLTHSGEALHIEAARLLNDGCATTFPQNDFLRCTCMVLKERKGKTLSSDDVRNLFRTA